MATTTEPIREAITRQGARAVGGRRFDAVMTALLFTFLAGLFVDGWAHFHGSVDDSFLTPWHAVFYGGFALTAGCLVLAMLINRARGLRGRAAAPSGYDLALLGAVVFAAGGVGDMAWHTLFGIETGPEALMSPSHLTLAVGMFLMLSGPMRAAWLRPGQPAAFLANLPGMLSLGFTLTGLSFITSYVNTATNPLGAAGYRPFSGELRSFFNPALGLGSVIITTGLFMGLVLLALRRWRLKPGSLTIIFTINIVFMSVLQDEYRLVPAWILAGVVGDFLIARLKPSVERPAGLRWFAFLWPASAYALYFLAFQLTDGIWWRVHTWGGAIALAGATGLLLSYLLVPPRIPDEAG